MLSQHDYYEKNAFTEMYRIIFLSGFLNVKLCLFATISVPDCVPWENVGPHYYCCQHPFNMAIPRQSAAPVRAQYAGTGKQSLVSELN